MINILLIPIILVCIQNSSTNFVTINSFALSKHFSITLEENFCIDKTYAFPINFTING